MEDEESKALKESLLNLDGEKTVEIVKSLLDKGTDPVEIIDVLRDALVEVGRKYEAGEFFLSELVMTGEIMKDVLSVLEPKLKATRIKTLGKIVVGTVQGDLHDIGKNIFAMLARAAGFEVIDLGVDVPAEKFVEAVKENKPEIVGLSALLTVTVPEIGTTIKALKEAGLRDKVKVIIGGAAVSKELGKEFGADYAADNAVEGVEVCKKWVGG